MNPKIFPQRCGIWLGVLLLFSAAPALADLITFNFDFEDPAAALVFNGTAQRITSPNRVLSGSASGQLTDLSVSTQLGVGAAGSIIFAHPIPTSFFETEFSFRLFGGDTVNPFGFAADGITFAVFGGNTPFAVGLCCSELGFGSIVGPGVPAFAVEFDTFDNEDFGCVAAGIAPGDCPVDSPAPHIAVNLGNSAAFSEQSNQALVPVPNLRNQVHQAHLSFADFLLNVSLDNQPVISDFLVPPQFVPASAFVGITGSTGSFSDFQIVDEWTLTAVPEPASLLLLLSGLGSLAGVTVFKRHRRRVG